MSDLVLRALAIVFLDEVSEHSVPCFVEGEGLVMRHSRRYDLPLQAVHDKQRGSPTPCRSPLSTLFQCHQSQLENTCQTSELLTYVPESRVCVDPCLIGEKQ